MALITLTFSGTINTSVQINDIVYAVNTVSLGGFNTGSSNDITILGPVTSVTTNTVVYDDTASGNQPSAGDFIMFSKDNTVNIIGITIFRTTCPVPILAWGALSQTSSIVLTNWNKK